MFAIEAENQPPYSSSMGVSNCLLPPALSFPTLCQSSDLGVWDVGRGTWNQLRAPSKERGVLNFSLDHGLDHSLACDHGPQFLHLSKKLAALPELTQSPGNMLGTVRGAPGQ